MLVLSGFTCLNTSDEYGQVSCSLAKVIVGYVSFQTVFSTCQNRYPPSKMFYQMILKIIHGGKRGGIKNNLQQYPKSMFVL